MSSLKSGHFKIDAMHIEWLDRQPPRTPLPPLPPLPPPPSPPSPPPSRVVQKRSEAENQIKRQRCPTRCVKPSVTEWRAKKAKAAAVCPGLDWPGLAHPAVRWWRCPLEAAAAAVVCLAMQRAALVRAHVENVQVSIGLLGGHFVECAL